MLYNFRMSHETLPLSAQTAYSQLLDAALAEATSRSVAALSGSFTRKTVKRQTYWYYSYREGERVRQIYVGPDSPRVQELVERKTAAPAASVVRSLARAYAVQNGAACLPIHVRLLRRLADFGFFRAGGILVGTHAFLAYANMLGVRWSSGEQTADVDLGWPGTNLSIALPNAPKADLHDALQSFEAGFVPALLFSGKPGASYRHKLEADFQVDFLTVLGRGGEKPKPIPALNINAQPLKFMEFLLESPAQAALFDRNGNSVIVSLPTPARYAVHKLIIFGLRPATFRTKAAKDLAQAGALIELLAETAPDELKAALADARSRGPSWRSKVSAGLKAIEGRQEATRLRSFLPRNG